MQQNIINETLKISGMTCINCENSITKKLFHTKGIFSSKANYSKNTVNIVYDSKIITIAKITEIIEVLGFKVIKKEDARLKPDFSPALAVIIIALALFLIIYSFGGLNIFNKFPIAKAGMGLGMLFLIGLLTSIHCVAMCGGINISQCVSNKPIKSNSNNTYKTLYPGLLYNLGRVVSYTIIGGIVGLIGSVISFSDTSKGIVQIIAGIFMVIMGLNMLNLFPWLRKINPHMPKIFARKINEKKQSAHPFYVGLLNGLMPCGPLQAMQLYALSTGSPINGALSMFVFSLGTVPLMFGLGALSSILNKKFTSKMITVSSSLVILMGLFMFSYGATLSGVSLPSKQIVSTGNSQSNNLAPLKNGYQIVETGLPNGRYEAITVQKGIPVKWTVKANAGEITGCNNVMIIPEYNIEKPLEVGNNVIEFTPKNSGTFGYSCWMGMVRSSITVTEDGSAAK